MKTRIIIIIMFLSVLAYTHVAAQDTIVSRVLPSQYLMQNYPDENDTVVFYSSECPQSRVVLRAIRHFAEDTLTIYGIMVGITELDSSRYVSHFHYQDPSFDKIDETFQIYVRDGDDIRPISEGLVFHPLKLPIRHYWDIQRYDWQLSSFGIPERVKPIPIYEQYFSTPLTVIGEFFLGFTTGATYHYVNGVPHYDRWGYVPASIFPDSPGGSPYEFWVYEAYLKLDDSESWFDSTYDRCYFTFPIIEPDPNADSNGNGDTLAIAPADPLQRLVRVSPNPAVQQVKVYASCGMQCLEVYDNTARLIHQQTCTGGTAMVNVSSWPSGTYIAKVYTPLGIINKKILVQ